MAIQGPVTITPQKAKFLWAERQQESGGNYSSVNSGSGALGAYQIMPSNLPGWLTESGLPQESSTAFLADHNAQDTVAAKILGGYYDKYGDAGAASMWYSGQPDPTKTYGNPPVYQYVADVLKLENSAPSTGLPGGISGGNTGTTVTTGTTQQAGLTSDILGLFGISDWKDAAERIGLVIFGGAMIVIALIKMTGADKKLAAGAKVGLMAETGGVL
jgi:hypothetical protein